MLTARAACALATSAFGLSAFTAAMMQPYTRDNGVPGDAGWEKGGDISASRNLLDSFLSPAPSQH